MHLSSKTDEKSASRVPIAPYFRRPHWLYVLWALPVSLFALPLAPLTLYRANWALRNGVLEITSPALSAFLAGPWFRRLAGDQGFAAASIGHVVIARDAHALASCRAHEHAHVRQCERWGPLFPFAYVLAGLYVACTQRRFGAYYWDNPFEVEARLAEHAVYVSPRDNPY